MGLRFTLRGFVSHLDVVVGRRSTKPVVNSLSFGHNRGAVKEDRPAATGCARTVGVHSFTKDAWLRKSGVLSFTVNSGLKLSRFEDHVRRPSAPRTPYLGTLLTNFPGVGVCLLV